MAGVEGNVTREIAGVEGNVTREMVGVEGNVTNLRRDRQDWFSEGVVLRSNYRINTPQFSHHSHSFWSS